jgi:hypothetical protein
MSDVDAPVSTLSSSDNEGVDVCTFKGAGVYLSGADVDGIHHAISYLSSLCEAAGSIPPELTCATEALHGIIEKHRASVRAIEKRLRRKDILRLALAIADSD